MLANRDTIVVEATGLPLDEDFDEFVKEARGDAVKAIARLRGAAARDRAEVNEAARLAVRRAALRWTGKKPQVKVIDLVDAK